MPGPTRNATKPNSRAHRRSPSQTIRTAIVDLPSAGCDLPCPPLPKGRSWTTPEKARWAELWTSPQAVMWDESCTGIAASVVVYEQAVYGGTASAWQAQELRHASESLGLTPKAMAALGWRIVDDE
jgi:hypothetical protein